MQKGKDAQSTEEKNGMTLAGARDKGVSSLLTRTQLNKSCGARLWHWWSPVTHASGSPILTLNLATKLALAKGTIASLARMFAPWGLPLVMPGFQQLWKESGLDCQMQGVHVDHSPGGWGAISDVPASAEHSAECSGIRSPSQWVRSSRTTNPQNHEK